MPVLIRGWAIDSESLLSRHAKRVAVVTGRKLLKKTVLEVLNAEAQSLGSPAVTDRMLRDWILEDLFPGPTEKGLGRGLGPEWRYSPAALRAALEVVRLKALGPRRFAALRLRLWLLDFDVPIDRIAEDLTSEFDRLLRRHFFRKLARYDARPVDKLSEREIKRKARRAGPVDRTLADAGLVPPSGDIVGFVSELEWGSAKPSQLLKSLDELVSQFASEKGQGILADFLRGLEPYIAVAGLFGNPDEIENSGLDELAALNEGDLTKGRRFYQFALAMADCASRGSEFLQPDIPPELSKALSKITLTLHASDEWCVAGVAACSIAAHRVGDTTSCRPNPTPR